MEDILRFPDECVGYLWYDAEPGEALKQFGPARGVLRVPRGTQLHVSIHDPAALPCLLPLAPDGVASMGLNKTGVTGSDLVHLAPFTGLTDLNFSKARALGDDGMVHLAGLRRLTALDLYATRVSDAGVRQLAGLTALRHLHLGATRVCGSGLASLAGLTRLRRLDLSYTRVEDASLLPLSRLPLEELVLRETFVTAEGVAAFARERPGCRLVGEWEYNEKALETARRRRWMLSALVHRIVPAHPLKPDASEEELLAVVSRLLPSGTRLHAVAADGRGVAGAVATVNWDVDRGWPDGAVREFLRGVPHHGRVGITLPGGSRFAVPWMVKRGPDRRGRPRPPNRTAN